MNRRLILFIAAALSLITCLGHVIGTLMSVPPELINVHATIETMKNTMDPMPVGASRSYMEILNGNNWCTSLLLLVCSMHLVSVANLPGDRATNRAIAVVAFGLAGFAVCSAVYFFPVPAVCAGIASALCVSALISVNSSKTVS